MKKKTTPMKRARVAVRTNGSIFTTKNLLMTIAAPEMIAVIKIRIVPIISFDFSIIFREVIMYLKFPSIIIYESFSVWESVA